MEEKEGTSFVFVEQDGDGGTLTKATLRSVRRHIARKATREWTTRKYKDGIQFTISNVSEILQSKRGESLSHKEG
jgi:hypothetical protein